MATNRFRNNIFIILLFTVTQISYSGIKSPTVNEYIRDDTGVYDSYICGLQSGLEWASEHYYRRQGMEIYCKPGNIELPITELRKIINKTINSKPGIIKEYENEHLIGLALRNGLIRKFPCQ